MRAGCSGGTQTGRNHTTKGPGAANFGEPGDAVGSQCQSGCYTLGPVLLGAAAVTPRGRGRMGCLVAERIHRGDQCWDKTDRATRHGASDWCVMSYRRFRGQEVFEGSI